MSSDVLTISREELYELVWSKPMVELAADVGRIELDGRALAVFEGNSERCLHRAHPL